MNAFVALRTLAAPGDVVKILVKHHAAYCGWAEVEVDVATEEEAALAIVRALHGDRFDYSVERRPAAHRGDLFRSVLGDFSGDIVSVVARRTAASPPVPGFAPSWVDRDVAGFAFSDRFRPWEPMSSVFPGGPIYGRAFVAPVRWSIQGSYTGAYVFRKRNGRQWQIGPLDLHVQRETPAGKGVAYPPPEVWATLLDQADEGQRRHEARTWDHYAVGPDGWRHVREEAAWDGKSLGGGGRVLSNE